MAKYSKIYHASDCKDKKTGFRFNYEESLLEYVSKYGFDDNCKEFKSKEWIVATSTGLNDNSWKDNPQYWVDSYNDEINEELSYMMEEFAQL